MHVCTPNQAKKGASFQLCSGKRRAEEERVREKRLPHAPTSCQVIDKPASLIFQFCTAINFPSRSHSLVYFFYTCSEILYSLLHTYFTHKHFYCIVCSSIPPHIIKLPFDSTFLCKICILFWFLKLIVNIIFSRHACLFLCSSINDSSPDSNYDLT